MSYELLDAPIESKEHVTIDEVEEIGETALEAVPVEIDNDPAKLIHEEFPSISPRPSERTGYRHHEDDLSEDTEQTQEAGQIQAQEAHSLDEFEQLLGHPLSEEIKQELRQLKAEKLTAIHDELKLVGDLSEQLKSELYTRWIKDGELNVPRLAEEATPKFIEILHQKLDEYLKTEVGQRDAKERQLREFIESPQPTEEDFSKAAALLGISGSRLSFLPGQKAKFATTLIAGAKEFLDGDAEFDEFIDYKRKTPEEQRASERQKAEDEISQLIHPLRRSFGDHIDHHFDIRKRREQRLADLPEKIAELEAVRKNSSSELLESANENPLTYTLSAVAKGNMTVEQAAAILVEKEGPSIKVSLGEMARDFEVSEASKFIGFLPEPSLLGLDIDETDLELVGVGFDKLSEILSTLGRKPSDKAETMKVIQKEIEKQQQVFFKEIGSEYDMYWHFSPFGLRIIQSRQLSPSQTTGNVMTGWHSRSLHFIKPGLTGMESMVDYTGYAESGLTHGTNARIEDAFGVVIIYPLGELATELPYRDEPAEEDRTSADTVFRESEGEAGRSLALEKAYILPMQTYEQVKKFREDPKYSDIFTQEWQPVYELADKLTKRALKLAGFDEAWIEEHVLPPVRYRDREQRRANTDEVYTETSQKIRAKLPQSEALILPVSAKKGGFEAHDVQGGKSGWHEKLIRLEV